MLTKINKLRELINYHIYKYYIEQDPEISDNDFDQLYIELQSLEKQYPEFDDPNSPTHKVNGGLENTFTEVYHTIPMLSLSKCMSLEEFEKWFSKMILKDIKQYTCEVKLDGLACSLTYDNGILIKGVTRGDGIKGEDITATVLTIPSIPKKINYNGFMEIRGEIILLKSSLNSINQIKKSKNEKEYQNVRNAASGILRSKNPSKEMGKYLRFGPYMLAQGNKKKSHSEDMVYLKSLGFLLAQDSIQTIAFDINSYITKNETLKWVQDMFTGIQNLRDSLDFDIDGIVIKANLYEDQNRLGCKTNVPNWATAFKFESERKMTKLLDIEHLLGAKGNITPRAILEPVKIGGTTITKPTLHNYDEINRLGLKIGDYVWVERRGDVIPKIVGIVAEMRSGNEIDIVKPINCPECGSILSYINVIPRCNNDDCIGGRAFKIQNYIKSLEIEEFGPSLVDKLVENNKIYTVPDIYNLQIDDIANLDRMGEKSAKKVIANIEKSKKASLAKLFTGLTIKMVGESTGQELAKKYNSIQEFSKATLQELLSIGDVVGHNIYNWLQISTNQDILNRLANYWVGNNEVSTMVASNKLNGKKFGFAGELPNLTRKQATKIITDNAGEISSIKKGMDYLLAGFDAKEAKVEKAKKYGAQILTEEQFLKMVE